MVYIFRIFKSFSVVSKTFSMPELRIITIFRNSFIEIFMSFFIVSHIKINIASVKVNKGIILIFLNSLIVIPFGILIFFNVIKSKSSVI